MARTWTQIRQLAARQLGFLVTGTADTGGTTTILRDNALSVYPNDRLIGYHIYLTSGSPTLTELLCTDFAQTNGDATFIPALGAAPDSLTYEFLPFSATDFLRACSDAILEYSDRGLLTREFVIRMVGGSPIYNADFSYWTSSTVVDGWSAASSTVARERNSTNIGPTETSVALSATAGSLSLAAPWLRYLADFRGRTVRFYCWVKTATASSGRINLIVDGTNNRSAYHSGGDSWELLSTDSIAIANGADVITPRLEYDSTATTNYYALPFIVTDTPIYVYPFPSVLMPEGPTSISVSPLDLKQDAVATNASLARVTNYGPRSAMTGWGYHRHHDEATATTTGIIDLGASRRLPVSPSVLTVHGEGPLTVPAANADSIEVQNEAESLLLATHTAVLLLERAKRGLPPLSRRTYDEDLARLREREKELARGAGQARTSVPLRLLW